MNSRNLKKRILVAVLFLFCMAVNIRILDLLHRLKASEDLLSLTYPAGGISDTAFSKWKNTDAKAVAETAAVWKSCGNLTVFSELNGHQETVCCYQMQGQPEAVFGKRLGSGRYFTKDEEGVCLLDVETVRKLFGSEDVLGLEVKLDGKILKVAGILNESRPVCVIPAEKGTAFDGIVIRRKDAGESSKLAVSLTEAVIGGGEEQTVDGRLYYITAGILYAVIAAAAFFVAGIIAGNRGKKGWRPGRRVFLLCIGIGCAALYVGIRAADPGSDYLPPYWSDFDFFGRLFEEKAGQIRQFLAHQEFPCWQRIAYYWRQVIGLECGSFITACCLSLMNAV